jgi:hypothetical protein
MPLVTLNPEFDQFFVCMRYFADLTSAEANRHKYLLSYPIRCF